MEDTKVGRGAFRYMTVLTVLALVNLVVSYFTMDAGAMYKLNTGRPGTIELSAFIAISLNLVFLFWNSILFKGLGRTLAAFVVTVFIAWLAEGLGVHYGYVFGHYHYTGLLGFQIWAVPVIVCMAWEPILYSAYCITDFLIPSEMKRSGSIASRIVPYLIMAAVGGIATTAWDLMIDPYAVGRGWWVWEEGGPYMQYIANGVPISNFFGWWKVAFVCHLVYRLILETGPAPRRSLYLSVYGPLMLYLNLFIGGLGAVLMFLKRPDVAMIGVMCMGALLLVVLSKVYLLRQGVALSPGYGWLMRQSEKTAG